MAVTGVIHHFGSFLLFSAVVLLIITNITAPVVNHISLMKVELGNATGQYSSAVTMGTYGYCLIDTPGGDFCSPSQVGYSPAAAVGGPTGLRYTSAVDDTARALTKVMVLHPIAAGVAFVAFLLSLGAGAVGSLLAALVAGLAFVVTLVPLITDFVLFGLIRAGVNQGRGTNDDSGNDAAAAADARAEWGAGIWTLLVAAICLLLGTVIVFFTCCSARMHRRRDARTTKAVDGYAPPPAPRRRRWF